MLHSMLMATELHQAGGALCCPTSERFACHSDRAYHTELRARHLAMSAGVGESPVWLAVLVHVRYEQHQGIASSLGSSRAASSLSCPCSLPVKLPGRDCRYIGQLLHSGEEVVVKIQRPGLKALFDIDLANLKVVAQQLDRKEDSTTDFV